LNEPSYNSPAVQQFGLRNLLTKVCNDGLFFRSAINRRERIYWCPGGNAGIPMVKKPKDRYHELTYRTHDFTHFLLPDLIFDGKVSKLSRFVYLSTRLMSEATTIMLADGLYVHCLLQDGFDYQTMDRRKIYPLVKATKTFEKAQNLQKIRDLLMASMQFCLTGGIDRFESLIDLETDKGALDDFVGKYAPFFIADFNWTVSNLDHMEANRTMYQQWDESTKHLRSDLDLYSVSDFVTSMNKSEEELTGLLEAEPLQLLDLIYATLIERNVMPFVAETKIDADSPEIRLTRTAKRYFIYQLFVFSLHRDVVPQAKQFERIFLDALEEEILTGEKIAKMRKLFEVYLDLCVHQNLLDEDDRALYSEMVPLFPPSYVSYDENAGSGREMIENLAKMEGFLKR
jgi:hypothetical protein